MTLNNKIAEWILEYCYKLASQELKETNQIEETMSRDLIQGVVDQNMDACGDVSTRSSCMLRLLVIMCQLADGHDINVEYLEDENPEQSTLEDAANNLSLLSDLLDENINLGELRSLVKQQAVFVFARNGDFTSAEAVAERMFGNQASPKEKTLKQSVDDILTAKDPTHPLLSQFSYDKLLQTWFITQEEIEKNLKIHKPFLIELAEKYTDIEKQKDNMQDKCWNELDVNIQGDVLKDLLQHFNAPVPFTSRKRSHWNNKRQAVQNNKAEVLGRIEMVMEDGDGHAESAEEVQAPAKPSASTPQENTSAHKQKKTARRRSSEDCVSKDNIFEKESPRSCTPAHPFSSTRDLPAQSQQDRKMLNVEKRAHSPMGRRAKRLWEPCEEEALWKGVQKFGAGKWSHIKQVQGIALRTNINIKDKWRSIIKDKHKYLTLESKCGKISPRKLGSSGN